MSVVYQLYPLVSKKDDGSAYIFGRPIPFGLHYDGPFRLEDEQLKLHSNGAVYVPGKIMKKYGYKRKDGKYAIAILPMLRPLNGKLVRGAVIPEIPGIEEALEDVKNTDIITWGDGIITVEHPKDTPMSLWYGEEYRFEIEKMEMNA